LLLWGELAILPAPLYYTMRVEYVAGQPPRLTFRIFRSVFEYMPTKKIIDGCVRAVMLFLGF
jgi:hypothetical protein